MSWRTITDRLKHSKTMLKLADLLGRGRGRLRPFDFFFPPPRAPIIPDLSQWNAHDISACWVGHATILLRQAGLNILTDPVFSDRVGPGLGLLTAGPRRHIRPALPFRQLPKIDLLLLSHAHFDHLDRPTLARLDKKIPVITAPNTIDLINDLGFRNIRELPVGQYIQFKSLRITAHYVKHWGARVISDTHRGYVAFLLESQDFRTLYGGDSAFGPHFQNLPPVDLAILGIGGYNPYAASHASPEQAWQMANDTHARYLLPMHHSTFALSIEPTAEPLQRLQQIAATTQGAQIIITQPGQQWHYDFPA